MKITLITAFPDFFEAFFSTSIIGKAVSRGLIQPEVIDLRDFAEGNYRQIDDYAYGGGGMVLMAEPLKKALEASSLNDNSLVVYPSPQGATLTQETVETLSYLDQIIIICGHYEGIDERINRKYVDLEISIGDFVVTGGEIPAMAIIDALARQIPGVVGKKVAVVEDSFYRGMLDHPHYTRPAVWEGESVPEILLSGNDREIINWRRKQAVERTLYRRPDLLGRANIQPYLEKGVYLLLLDSSVLRNQEDLEADLFKSGLDDMVSICRYYGIKRTVYINPDSRARDILKEYNKYRNNNVKQDSELSAEKPEQKIKCVPSFRSSLNWIRKKEKAEPFTILLAKELEKGSMHWIDVKRQLIRSERPVVFIYCLDDVSVSKNLSFDVLLQPVRAENTSLLDHLSHGSNIAVILDRFFGLR